MRKRIVSRAQQLVNAVGPKASGAVAMTAPEKRVQFLPRPLRRRVKHGRSKRGKKVRGMLEARGFTRSQSHRRRPCMFLIHVTARGIGSAQLTSIADEAPFTEIGEFSEQADVLLVQRRVKEGSAAKCTSGRTQPGDSAETGYEEAHHLGS